MTRIAPAVVRYGLSIAAVAVVVGVNLALGLREHFSTALFLAAVAGCAWYGGLGSGLIATLASALALDFFFVGKELAIDLNANTWIWLLVFTGVAIFLNVLAESQRRLLTELRAEGQRKTQFLAILAHELRNFLSPVSTAVAVLRVEAEQNKLRADMCGIMERQIENMNRLVGDLLDGARIAQGKLQLQREPVDLREIVTSARNAVQPLVDERGHQLQVDVPNAPLALHADRVRIEQVVVNLLTNAANYTDSGGNIWVRLNCENDDVVLRVRDNGKGISAELLPHLFNLFVQAEPGSRGGLGIGLNLVQRLVHLHGGNVTAASDGLGCGSEFTVRIPRLIDITEMEPSNAHDASPQTKTVPAVSAK
jgi:signal transduction histidine kinase